MPTLPISHALVLPEKDFLTWYNAADAYAKAFERVAIIRSPAGNDLNRFRNVTAVQTPGVWLNEDALGHIRRVYPLVVRVDVIRASAPAQLAAALQSRISAKDRYGEAAQDGHINDRFTLDWMTNYRPARIVKGFNDDLGGGRKNEGLDIDAPPGSKIFAAAAGTVATVVRQPTALGYGQYVQIASTVGGQNYLVTYTQLQNIRVNMGQVVKVGDQIGESNWQTIKVIVQQPGKGLSGYAMPDVVDPTMLIYWQGIRLKTNASGLRIREKPGTDFKQLAMLRPFERAETLEPHGRTLLKVGLAGQWLKIRSPQAIEGFASAEYLFADETEGVSALNMTGMNLDLLHRLGKPDPARLKGTGWVRFAYNVSMGTGSQDLERAFNFYSPFINAYAKAGLKVMLVLTHQTFGEGAGYVWPQMDLDKWRDLTGKFSNFARQIAARFAGRDLIGAYQIWNEQDTPGFGGAAVSMPPNVYGYLLGEAIKSIRGVDTKTPIITGGHMSGPGTGGAYARTTIANLPSGIRPDGIACHSYGRGVPGNKYAIFGSIDEDVDTYGRILPGAQVWITEWGVLDRNQDPPSDISDYALGFIRRLKTLYPAKVAAAVWYAWADSMHNGYGLVGLDDQPKQPLYSQFLGA